MLLLMEQLSSSILVKKLIKIIEVETDSVTESH